MYAPCTTSTQPGSTFGPAAGILDVHTPTSSSTTTTLPTSHPPSPWTCLSRRARRTTLCLLSPVPSSPILRTYPSVSQDAQGGTPAAPARLAHGPSSTWRMCVVRTVTAHPSLSCGTARTLWASPLLTRCVYASRRLPGCVSRPATEPRRTTRLSLMQNALHAAAQTSIHRIPFVPLLGREVATGLSVLNARAIGSRAARALLGPVRRPIHLGRGGALRARRRRQVARRFGPSPRLSHRRGTGLLSPRSPPGPPDRGATASGLAHERWPFLRMAPCGTKRPTTTSYMHMLLQGHYRVDGVVDRAPSKMPPTR